MIWHILSVVLLIFSSCNLIAAQFEEESSSKLFDIHPHSLKAPYADNMEIAYFDFGGDTIIENYEYIRLTPDLSSRSGYLWSKLYLPVQNWQVEIEFKIHGTSSYISGDGFAFWATKERLKPGNVFGNQDYFEGLGIFFDTYANTHQEHSFPYVMAMVGDGRTPYNNDEDGKSNEVAGCSADIKHRNIPTKALITYARDRFLEVKLQYETEGQWIHCFTTTNATVPREAYMGFTAHTGELKDAHDIISIVTKTAKSGLDYNPTYNSNSGSKINHSGGFWAKIGWLLKLVLVVVVIGIVVVAYRAHQSQSNKRF